MFSYHRDVIPSRDNVPGKNALQIPPWRDYAILETGYWMLDTGYWMLDKKTTYCRKKHFAAHCQYPPDSSSDFFGIVFPLDHAKTVASANWAYAFGMAKFDPNLSANSVKLFLSEP